MAAKAVASAISAATRAFRARGPILTTPISAATTAEPIANTRTRGSIRAAIEIDKSVGSTIDLRSASAIAHASGIPSAAPNPATAPDSFSDSQNSRSGLAPSAILIDVTFDLASARISNAPHVFAHPSARISAASTLNNALNCGIVLSVRNRAVSSSSTTARRPRFDSGYSFSSLAAMAKISAAKFPRTRTVRNRRDRSSRIFPSPYERIGIKTSACKNRSSPNPSGATPTTVYNFGPILRLFPRSPAPPRASTT